MGNVGSQGYQLGGPWSQTAERSADYTGGGTVGLELDGS